MTTKPPLGEAELREMFENLDDDEGGAPFLPRMPERPKVTATPEQIVPPRFDALDNVPVRAEGVELLRPDPRAVVALQAENPKITYFPTPGAEVLPEEGKRRTGEPEYFVTVTTPLMAHLAERFADTKVALRAVKSSLNGTVQTDTMAVHDLSMVMQQGEEQGHGRMNVAVLNPDDLGTIERVNQYATYTSLFRDDLGDETQANNVFPVILVYDDEQLQHKGRYAAEFRDPEAADQALLAAYIVDCP